MEKKKANRKFINTTSISKHLQCTICQEIFYDPRRYECGYKDNHITNRHTFCFACINKWLKANQTCPICRDQLTNPGKDLIALNIINDLPVLCIYKNCPWRGALVELDNHLRSCYFDPKNLPECVKITFKEEEKKNELLKNNEKASLVKGEKEEIEIDINEDENNKVNLCTSLKARLYQKNPTLMNNVFKSTLTTNAKPNSDKSDIDVLLSYLKDKDKGDEDQKDKENILESFLQEKRLRDNE